MVELYKIKITVVNFLVQAICASKILVSNAKLNSECNRNHPVASSCFFSCKTKNKIDLWENKEKWVNNIYSPGQH